MYIVFGIFSGIIGSIFSILMRIELQASGSQILAGANMSIYTLIKFNILTTIINHKTCDLFDLPLYT